MRRFASCNDDADAGGGWRRARRAHLVALLLLAALLPTSLQLGFNQLLFMQVWRRRRGHAKDNPRGSATTTSSSCHEYE